MRLRRLDLTRFGKFSDQSIEFGEKPQQLPDLHIVYGPNEAGKSTALAAFLDLLFGIDPRSSFNFLHPYSTMRVGGALEFAADAREFIRIKRPQNSLLDSEDRPIAESSIRSELAGIDRESYRTMFSLDDETLEKGGESILASKGDLGELLFSASAGLADLSRKLRDLSSVTDAFYKHRSRSGALNELKARLVQLKSEREQIDTLASEYARLIDVRDRAAAQYDEAMTERTDTQRRAEEVQRHLTALPRLSALRSYRERLLPLAELPIHPPAWGADVPRVMADEIELCVKMRGVADEVERLSTQVDSIEVDEPASLLASKMERVAVQRARYVTAEKDLPERRLQLQAEALAVSGILIRMERAGERDPRRLLLGASSVGRLRELVESRSGFDNATQTATRELADARRRLSDAVAALQDAGSDAMAERARDKAIVQLSAALTAARGADHMTRRRLAERALEAADSVLNDQLRMLHPWRGEGDDLLAMQCPSADTIRQRKTAIDDAQSQMRQYAGDADRLTSETRRLQAERDSLANVSGIVSDHEAAAIRMLREQAWSGHRLDLTIASADAFEHALRQDDIVTLSRQTHLSDLAKLHQTERGLAVNAVELDRTVELKRGAAAKMQSIRREIDAGARLMGALPADEVSLSDLESWLVRREKALETREAVLAARRASHDAIVDEEEARDRLKYALDVVGLAYEPTAGFEILLEAAQSVLDRDGEARGLRLGLEKRKQELAQREGALEHAKADDQAWSKAWIEACKACWLGDQPEIPTLATVREILSAINDLGPAVERQAGLTDRIEKMEKDQAAFRAEVIAICNEIGMAADADSVLDLARRVEECVHNAVANRTQRAKAADNLEEARNRQRSLAEALAIHEERKNAMTSFFGISSLEAVAGKLSDLSKRDQLHVDVEHAEREILEALRITDVVEAERVLDLFDRANLETELIELRARLDDRDRRCHELYASKSQADDKVEAIGGDSKVAEIEERRRTTLLEIQDGAERYLQSRAGSIAMEQALRTYREQHRSSMMTRASAAFQTVSRGNYTGLATQPGKDCESLIAISAGGGSKLAHELSKGTRFQLYLALRVAGYHEFVRARGAVPFVADDIMETFDDFRAEEAFKVFGDMAKVGQVIYLTHHRHLCEIARKVYPDARIHEIGGA